jgi:hypothetical protein
MVVANEVLLFFGLIALGIPLFWYWIGSRIDRRLRRPAVANELPAPR